MGCCHDDYGMRDGRAGNSRIRGSDRAYGSCSMCRHMKRTHLEDILQAIESPAGDQIVEIEDSIIQEARVSLDQMFALSDA